MGKIIYVTNSSQPGGMEKQVLDLIVGMTRLSWEVHVWCPDGPFCVDYENAGAVVTRKSPKFDLDLPYIFSLSKYMRDKKFDVVHAHELKAASNALIAGFLAGILVRISHTHTPISTWGVSKFKRFINKTWYTFIVNLLSTKEVALTSSIQEIKIHEGISWNKLVVIPNGIDVARFNITDDVKKNFRDEIFSRYQIPHDAFVIGNLSRLTVEKGYDVLIDAFSKLSKLPKFTKQNLFLLIAGGGVLKGQYEEKIAKLGLADKVKITGLFDEADKLKFHSTIDLILFTSFTEGFGYVVIEGMAFGTPIIASDLAVLKDVGQDTLSYFKAGDDNDLVKVTTECLNSSGNTKEKVVMAKRRVQDEFTLNKFWERYNTLYQGNPL